MGQERSAWKMAVSFDAVLQGRIGQAKRRLEWFPIRKQYVWLLSCRKQVRSSDDSVARLADDLSLILALLGLEKKKSAKKTNNYVCSNKSIFIDSDVGVTRMTPKVA